MRTVARLTCSVLGATLAVSTLVAQSGSQQPQQQQPPPTPPEVQQTDANGQPIFRTGINFVRVDVIATDKNGNPVVDLNKDDFEVLEDNKKQDVETFRLVKIDMNRPVETSARIRTRNDEETAAANEDSRIFVFFLDDYHTRLGTSMAVRKHLTEFVANQVGANDLLAVMYPLAPLDTVVLTRDHESVIRVLEKFEGRKWNYTPRNSAEERYAYQPTEVVEIIRRQVALSALEGLSIKLGSLREGRKSIILVSEGYTALLPPQMRDQNAQMPGLGNPNRNNPMAGEGNNIYEDRAKFAASLDVQRELQNVFDAANRNNTAIYSVDPRGLATGEFDIDQNISLRTSNESLSATQDTLRILSDNSDGRAIVNRNDLAKGMEQIMRDSSAYYLLGYNSSQAPRDGKFHAIKVRVKRSGIQVRARRGYWALNVEETKTALAPPKAGPPTEITKAFESLAQPSSGRYVRTWTGTSVGEGGKTKVTFVWEPLPVAPGARRAAPQGVTLLVASPAGDVVYRGEVSAHAADGNGNGNGGAGAVPQGALVSFDAPPGKLEMRMTVKGADKETLDTENRELLVPDLTTTEVRIGTPRIYVARNVKEFQQLSQDTSTPPAVGREFRRTDRLLIRVEAFGPGEGGNVTSRLLNRQGQKMVDLPVTKGEGALRTIDLPLANLAPGDYLLEVAAATEGQQPVSELIAFKIGN